MSDGLNPRYDTEPVSGRVPEPGTNGEGARSAWPDAQFVNDRPPMGREYPLNGYSASHGVSRFDGHEGGRGGATWSLYPSAEQVHPAVPESVGRARSGAVWVLSVCGVIVVAVVSVVVTLAATGRFADREGAVAASDIHDLLARAVDFPQLQEGRHHYTVYPIDARSPTDSEENSIDDCDRLVDPEDEYPGVVYGVSRYYSASSGPYGASFEAKVFMRELKAWDAEFTNVLAGCPKKRTDTSVDTHYTPYSISGIDGEAHVYQARRGDSDRRVPVIVGVAQGVSIEVSVHAGEGKSYTPSLERDLVTLYNNQLRRILDAT